MPKTERSQKKTPSPLSAVTNRLRYEINQLKNRADTKLAEIKEDLRELSESPLLTGAFLSSLRENNPRLLQRVLQVATALGLAVTASMAADKDADYPFFGVEQALAKENNDTVLVIDSMPSDQPLTSVHIGHNPDNQFSRGVNRDVNEVEQQTNTGYVTLSGLNLRTSPSLNSSVKHNLYEGEIVKILEEVPDGTHDGWTWYQIETEDGLTGYASPAYIETDSPQIPTAVERVPTPEPTETPEPTPEPNQDTESGDVMLAYENELHAQTHHLSCESAAAEIMCDIYDIPLIPGYDNWEGYFVNVIPEDCNPHEGFRGNIDGGLSTQCDNPNLGYGTYAEPIANAMNHAFQRLTAEGRLEDGYQARVHYGLSYEEVFNLIQQGYPVQVWVSGRTANPYTEVDPETGQEYSLQLGEHSYVVVGAQELNDGQMLFDIYDPWQGRYYQSYSFPNWLNVFGGMGVSINRADANHP